MLGTRFEYPLCGTVGRETPSPFSKEGVSLDVREVGGVGEWEEHKTVFELFVLFRVTHFLVEELVSVTLVRPG